MCPPRLGSYQWDKLKLKIPVVGDYHCIRAWIVIKSNGSSALRREDSSVVR